jgi:hypothetical protein
LTHRLIGRAGDVTHGWYGWQRLPQKLKIALRLLQFMMQPIQDRVFYFRSRSQPCGQSGEILSTRDQESSKLGTLGLNLLIDARQFLPIGIRWLFPIHEPGLGFSSPTQ